MNFNIKETGKEFEWGHERQAVRSLYEQLQGLKDKRNRGGIRYPLAVQLVMVIVAKQSGEDDVRGIAKWIKYRARAIVSANRPIRIIVPRKNAHDPCSTPR
jgi:DDE_Tnp_1-associated